MGSDARWAIEWAYQDVFSLVVGMVSATVLRHLAEARRVDADGGSYTSYLTGLVVVGERQDKRNIRIVHGTGCDAGGVAGVAQPWVVVSADRWNQTTGQSRVGTYEPG